MYSADLYLALSCDFGKMGLDGFRWWCTQQWREENNHVLRFAKYIVARDGSVTLEDTKAPDQEWECPWDGMSKALEHEHLVSKRIDALVRQARDESDYATENFLQWFVSEQVEEESAVNAIVAKLKMVNSDPAGIIHCDVLMSRRPAVCE